MKLKKENNFNVYIMAEGYESKKIKLLAENDKITRANENAVFIDQLKLGYPESFDFRLKGDSFTGVLT